MAADTADDTPPALLLSSSPREREFLRYAEAAVGISSSKEGRVAVSSKDAALTAYAQVICLRLNAKRAFISLFDKKRQYIIAEATQTLSLQQDDVHADADAMWFGAGVLERQRDDFNTQTLKSHKKGATTTLGFFAVRDLSQDERFSQHRLVLNPPYGRAYAGVPLISPSGFPVGTLSILDDKPRHVESTGVEIKFMQDIATTVISHLEMARATLAHGRGLRMVKGLSGFVEGKDSIDENDGQPHHRFDHMRDRLNQQSANVDMSARARALNAASNKERLEDAHYESQDQIKPRPSSAYDIPSRSARQTSRSISPPNNHVQRDQQSRTANGMGASDEASVAGYDPQTPDTEGGFLSTGVRSSFQRAAVIVNQALATSGVLFLDASISEFGRLRSSGGDGGSSSEGYTTSASNESDKEKDDASKLESGSLTEEDYLASQKPCRQLASAYDPTEMMDSNAGVLHRGVPERFLKSVMRRHPYGSIWHFDDDGSNSSDEFSEGSSATESTNAKASPISLADQSRSSRPRRHKSRRLDAQVIQTLFPGARAVMMMPMWDTSRRRFFAGAIAWTYRPMRVLTSQEDLTFLGAFCDVIMAEVGRLDAQNDAQVKESFISSISHELKSPLHGILGGVECLLDKVNESVHDEILQMIDASGRSLLEIINHLLEHADATSKRTQSVKGEEKGTEFAMSPRNSRRSRAAQQPVQDLALLTEEILDTAIWSDPSRRPWWNQSSKPEYAPSQNHTPIKVVLEVNPANLSDTGWNFKVNAGAWKRIVQNLTSNSIKYTESGGYLRVLLSARAPNAKLGTNAVELVCTDSGRGMSQKYLDHGLWQAFSQEDPHSSGTGLGLSLVHNIVKGMGGSIHVQSSQGVNSGTTIRVSIPLVPGRPEGPFPTNVLDADTSRRLASSTFALLGFDEDSSQNQRTLQANNVVAHSISNSLQGNGMHLSEGIADVYILPQVKAIAIAKDGPRSRLEADALTKPKIVLCHSIISAREFTASGMTLAATLTQPFGPRKLLQALANSIGDLASIQNTSSDHESPSESMPMASGQSLTSPSQEHDCFDFPAIDSTANPSSTVETAERRTSGRGRVEERDLGKQSTSCSRPQLNVLLVDDNNTNLSLLRALMKKAGHHYISAVNGQEAVDAYKEAYDQHSEPGHLPPTVVLMDITMPVMDGLEATRQIRAMERARQITPAMIIALTAADSAQARQEAFSSGLDLFLTKPVRLKELTSILDEHLQSQRFA